MSTFKSSKTEMSNISQSFMAPSHAFFWGSSNFSDILTRISYFYGVHFFPVYVQILIPVEKPRRKRAKDMVMLPCYQILPSNPRELTLRELAPTMSLTHFLHPTGPSVSIHLFRVPFTMNREGKQFSALRERDVTHGSPHFDTVEQENDLNDNHVCLHTRLHAHY